LDGSPIPAELIGTIALTVAFVLVTWAILREAGKWLVRGLLAFGLLLGIAVVTGLLDNSQAGGMLYWVGTKVGEGVVVVASWLAATWQGLTGAGETPPA
jgi:hypothetical protein